MMRAGLKSKRIAAPALAIGTFWEMVRGYRIQPRGPNRVTSTAQALLLIHARITGVTEIGEADPGGKRSFTNFTSDCLAASRASHENCPVYQSLESPQSS